MKRKILSLLALSLLILTACGVPSAKNSSTSGDSSSSKPKTATYKTITPQEAHDMMGKQEKFILLDVRTEEEFAESHIENALLIPYDEIEAKAATELPEKDAVILVYCRSGRRSAIAAESLAKMGYTNVYDFGGINDWPFETVAG